MASIENEMGRSRPQDDLNKYDEQLDCLKQKDDLKKHDELAAKGGTEKESIEKQNNDTDVNENIIDIEDNTQLIPIDLDENQLNYLELQSSNYSPRTSRSRSPQFNRSSQTQSSVASQTVQSSPSLRSQSPSQRSQQVPGKFDVARTNNGVSFDPIRKKFVVKYVDPTDLPEINEEEMQELQQAQYAQQEQGDEVSQSKHFEQLDKLQSPKEAISDLTNTTKFFKFNEKDKATNYRLQCFIESRERFVQKSASRQRSVSPTSKSISPGASPKSLGSPKGQKELPKGQIRQSLLDGIPEETSKSQSAEIEVTKHVLAPQTVFPQGLNEEGRKMVLMQSQSQKKSIFDIAQLNRKKSSSPKAKSDTTRVGKVLDVVDEELVDAEQKNKKLTKSPRPMHKVTVLLDDDTETPTTPSVRIITPTLKSGKLNEINNRVKLVSMMGARANASKNRNA